jgi:Leucine-rich repeat (LRR) protein
MDRLGSDKESLIVKRTSSTKSSHKKKNSDPIVELALQPINSTHVTLKQSELGTNYSESGANFKARLDTLPTNTNLQRLTIDVTIKVDGRDLQHLFSLCMLHVEPTDYHHLDALRFLPALTSLRLLHNNWHPFKRENGVELACLTQLKELDLSRKDCRLDEIHYKHVREFFSFSSTAPDYVLNVNLAPLTNLERLDISENDINFSQSGISALPKLHSLTMTQRLCPIYYVDIEPLSSLSSLTSLDVSRCVFVQGNKDTIRQLKQRGCQVKGRPTYHGGCCS